MKLPSAFLRTAALVAAFAAAPVFAHEDCDCMNEKTAATVAKTYPLKGVIVDILPDQSALLVKHEAIPGLMKAMTMAFNVDAVTLKSATKDQAITATLSRRGDDWWLTDVKPVAKP